LTGSNVDGSCRPESKLYPSYDRSSLHRSNHAHGSAQSDFRCLLVFLIQWIFLGNLRSALIVGINIPSHCFFATISVGDSRRKCQPAFGGCCRFRHHRGLGRHSRREHLPKFSAQHEERQELLDRLGKGYWGPDPTQTLDPAMPGHGWTHRLRLILISALQVDKAVLFSALITVAGFRAPVHHAGRRGSDFWTHGPHLRLRARRGFNRDLHGHSVIASFLLPARVKELRRSSSAPCTVCTIRPCALLCPIALWSLESSWRSLWELFSWIAPRLGSEFLPHLEEGNFWIRASMPITLSLEDGEQPREKMREILKRHPEVLTVVSQHGRPDDGSDASPFFECRVVCSAEIL